MSRYAQTVGGDDRNARRYDTMLETLAPFASMIEGQRVLDFGCAHATSVCALLELGAHHVTGVEPDLPRVEQGRKLLAQLGLEDRAEILHLEDTRRLPFPERSFPTILANAVLEHIPQPRDEYIRELWRLVAPGGHLIVNETPNKYLPIDFHTTGLWWVPWLPRTLAQRYARWRGFDREEDWDHSGWRGLGHYELLAPLRNYRLLPELSRPRHRLLHRLGLPSSLLDPYPTWILERVR